MRCVRAAGATNRHFLISHNNCSRARTVGLKKVALCVVSGVCFYGGKSDAAHAVKVNTNLFDKSILWPKHIHLAHGGPTAHKLTLLLHPLSLFYGPQVSQFTKIVP
jgi:hypothetical protein